MSVGPLPVGPWAVEEKRGEERRREERRGEERRRRRNFVPTCLLIGKRGSSWFIPAVNILGMVEMLCSYC